MPTSYVGVQNAAVSFYTIPLSKIIKLFMQEAIVLGKRQFKKKKKLYKP